MSFWRPIAILLLAAAPLSSDAAASEGLPDPGLVLAELQARRPAAFAPASRALLLASPADRADVDALWARIQLSPLGRELSAAFVARGRPVLVVFEKMDTTVHGGELDGPRAWSEFESSPFAVVLSDVLREPRWRDEGAGTLAHELLGHVDRYQALPPGLSTSTYHLYAGDETYASLVGWTVSLELGARGSEAQALEMASGRASVESRRRFTTLAYAQALSLAEMSAPAEAYAARRDDAARERKAIANNADFYAFMNAAADHFVSVHGEDPSRYAAMRAGLEAGRATLARSDERFKDAESWLGRLAEGGPEGETLRAAAGHPFFADVEGRIAALSARVRALPRPPAPAVAAPSAAASSGVDQNELLSMMKRDVPVHPDFWAAASAGLRR